MTHKPGCKTWRRVILWIVVSGRAVTHCGGMLTAQRGAISGFNPLKMGGAGLDWPGGLGHGGSLLYFSRFFSSGKAKASGKHPTW